MKNKWFFWVQDEFAPGFFDKLRIFGNTTGYGYSDKLWHFGGFAEIVNRCNNLFHWNLWLLILIGVIGAILWEVVVDCWIKKSGASLWDFIADGLGIIYSSVWILTEG